VSGVRGAVVWPALLFERIEKSSFLSQIQRSKNKLKYFFE
jgi:hypothetical protein